MGNPESLGDVLKPQWVRARGRDKMEPEKHETREDSEQVERFAVELGKVRGYVDYGPREQVEGIEGYRREVKAYVLFGYDKEGKPIEVNLLERFNPMNAKVYEQPSLGSMSGAYYHDRKEVAVSDMRISRMAPHTLLHELRHAVQTGEKFERLMAFYRSVLSEDYYKEDSYSVTHSLGVQELEIILELVLPGADVFPMTKHLLEQIYEVDKLYAEARESGASKEELKRLIGLYPTGDTELIKGVTIKDVRRLPTLIIERDAEYGALIALRALKQEFGIDIFEPYGSGDALTRDWFEPEPEPGEDIMTVQRLRGKIYSLGRIQDYLHQIGVPEHCLRELRKGNNKPPGVQKIEEIERESTRIAARMERNEMRKKGIDPSEFSGKFLDEGVPSEPGWLETHGEDDVPNS